VGYVMGQLHWKTCGPIVLLAMSPIVTINPALAQPPVTALEIAQAEGGKALTKLTRAQQAYFLENNQFSRTLPALGTEIPKITPNYLQYIAVQNKFSVTHYAIARRPNLKSYVGRVVVMANATGEAYSSSIVCESKFSGMRRIPPIPQIGPNRQLICPPGTTEWTLSSIATPAESEIEAKQTIGMLVRSQQAYYLENNRFATNFDEFGRNIRPSNFAYDYSIQATDRFAVQYGVSRRSDLKSYVGAAAIIAIIGGDFTSTAIVCENIKPGPFLPAPPILSDNGQALICAAGTESVGR
jgi:Type IV pilin-like G and H, putative